MRKLIILALLCWLSLSNFAQTNKIPLTHSVYDSWTDIANPNIANNGSWIFYEVNPQDGDGNLWLSKTDKSFQKNFSRGYKASISGGNSFIVYQIKPFKNDVRKAKLDKKKKEDMPKDSLGVYTFENSKSYLY
ncbi:MAG: S9 family peptidase, partial [Bacteroidales bacterium]